MTTRVTVEPAGHRVAVTQMEVLEEGEDTSLARATKTVLEPGDSPREFYIHSGKTLEIEEVGEA